MTKVDRPKLTKKAKAAIILYVNLHVLPKAKRSYIIELALTADRLPREDLYSILKDEDYRWSEGKWAKLKRRK